MSSCSHVCCRSLSCSLELLADRQRSSEHRGWHNLPSTNEESPCRYRTSHEPRGPSSTSLAPSTVAAPVCRSYRKRTADLAGTRYTMCCPFRTAPTAFTWTSRRTARRRLWNTTAGDWCSATAGPERPAVRQQAVSTVRCRLLCENGTAAAKLSAV